MDKWLGKYPVTSYNIIVPVYKKVNKQFFKKWTKEMAYVLGFFAADGYITLNNRGAQFWCIDVIDKEIIEQIKKQIDSDHKISARNRENGKYVSYRIQIGSIEMCNDLRNLGYNERKTKSLVVPNVPDKFFGDFVRGYFDGDGNVWTGLIHKERNTMTFAIQTVFTSCSIDFLNSLNNKLGFFGIKKGVVRKGKGEYYRLTYSTSSSLNLYKFVYNKQCIKSKLFLTRKKMIFDKFVESKMRS